MYNNKHVKIYSEQAPVIYRYTSMKPGPDPMYEYRVAFNKLHKEGPVMLDLTEYNNPTWLIDMAHVCAANNLAEGNMTQDQFDTFLKEYEQARVKLLKLAGDE